MKCGICNLPTTRTNRKFFNEEPYHRQCCLDIPFVTQHDQHTRCRSCSLQLHAHPSSHYLCHRCMYKRQCGLCPRWRSNLAWCAMCKRVACERCVRRTPHHQCSKQALRAHCLFDPLPMCTKSGCVNQPQRGRPMCFDHQYESWENPDDNWIQSLWFGYPLARTRNGAR